MDHTEDYILTFDLGTTNCKAVVFALDGTIAGIGKASYPEQRRRPGWVEQKPGDWWVAMISSAHDALSLSGIARHRIVAISLTGQMHGIVPVDGTGKPLMPCLTLRDVRATAEVHEIVSAIGLEQVYHVTGARLAPSLPLAKIRWIQKNRPSLYRQTGAFLPTKDYIRCLLTGGIATDTIDAAGMLIYDIRERTWSPEIAEAAGISLHRLPPVRPAWEIAGKLREGAARQLGLIPGTPVVIGAGDDIEFLGLGVLKPGEALEHVGTTGSVMTCVDEIMEDPEMAVEVYPHVDPSLWLVGGSVNAAGETLEWARRVFSNDQSVDLDVLLSQRNARLPALDDPLIFLPYLAGERCPIWNPAAKGGWLGLTRTHERRDLLYAVMEGVAFSLKHVLERIERESGPVTSLAVQGSDADSPWLLMRADVYGKRLRLLDSSEPTSLGAMILAGVGIGVFTDIVSGVEATCRRQHWVDPDQEASSRYRQLFALYKGVSSICQSLFGRFDSHGGHRD